MEKAKAKAINTKDSNKNWNKSQNGKKKSRKKWKNLFKKKWMCELLSHWRGSSKNSPHFDCNIQLIYRRGRNLSHRVYPSTFWAVICAIASKRTLKKKSTNKKAAYCEWECNVHVVFQQMYFTRWILWAVLFVKSSKQLQQTKKKNSHFQCDPFFPFLRMFNSTQFEWVAFKMN